MPEPEESTFGTVLTACGNMRRLKQGKEIHGTFITNGMSSHVVVESSLLDMYGKSPTGLALAFIKKWFCVKSFDN